MSEHSLTRKGEGRFFIFILPLWLFGLIFPAMVSPPEQRELFQILTLAWITPACLHIGRSYFVYSGIYRGSLAVRLFMGLFVATYWASSALSVDPVFSLAYAVVTSFGLICCGGIWSCIQGHILSALATYAFIGSAFSLYAYWNGASVQGRLTFGDIGHPNLLGIVCFGTLACCLAIGNVMIKLALIALNGFVILQTGGRSCLIASAITVSVYILLTVSVHSGRFTRFSLAAALLVALGVGAIYADEIADVTSTLLFLNDPSRGLGSGFTGRMDAWHEAYQLFLRNPILGIGFRTHERFISILPSAHNGYISVLAETGILGVSTILLLIGFCLRRIFQMALTGDRTAIIGVSFVAGYLFVSMFERILVNFGSPTSVLMWVFLLMPRWPRPGIKLTSESNAKPNVLSFALANG